MWRALGLTVFQVAEETSELKYPRTFICPIHRCDGGRQGAADLSWLDGELVVTEKLDGGT